MVIGDDPIDQLERFQRAEYAEPSNRHFVTTEVTQRVRARHELWTQGPEVRPSGLGPYDGLNVLESGQAPDLANAHHWGWVSLAPDGAIIQAFARDIPRSFIDWFERTCDRMKLKPGASGWSFDANGKVETLIGQAGSARKRDVDLAGICQPFRDEAAAWWDRAMAACGGKPWVSHRDICARHKLQKNSEADPVAAIRSGRRSLAWRQSSLPPASPSPATWNCRITT